jgi:DNA-binding CsgD family transcriptional regulator
MLAIATEMMEAGEKAGFLEIAQQANVRCAVIWLELGDIAAAEREIAAVKRINARIRQPLFTMYECSLDASVALLRGELQEAERLLVRAMQIKPPGATYSADPLSVLIFTLRREQGRLDEIAPLLPSFVRQNPSASVWKPGLGVLHLELGDLAAARAVFEELTADAFASLPRDSRWSTCLIYLAEICAALGNTEWAPVLYRFLLPWADRNIVLGGGTGCWGPAARFLGLLATTMSRWTDAERHFTAAVDMCQRITAHAPLAHARHDLAVMLLIRGFPGDRERADVLLRQALDSAQDLGLAGLVKRISDRIADLPPVSALSTVPDGLTTRELDVLRLLAIGRGNADIALVLDISLNTVATHVRNILSKTGCANRTEAAAYAMRHGLQAHA